MRERERIFHEPVQNRDKLIPVIQFLKNTLVQM